jgi:hypothetical protein
LTTEALQHFQARVAYVAESESESQGSPHFSTGDVRARIKSTWE